MRVHTILIVRDVLLTMAQNILFDTKTVVESLIDINDAYNLYTYYYNYIFTYVLHNSFL